MMIYFGNPQKYVCSYQRLMTAIIDDGDCGLSEAGTIKYRMVLFHKHGRAPVFHAFYYMIYRDHKFLHLEILSCQLTDFASIFLQTNFLTDFVFHIPQDSTG